MNININEIKNGMTIIIDGKLCLIEEFQHVKPGKGAAFMKMKLRNLRTGALVEDTYNTNITSTSPVFEQTVAGNTKFVQLIINKSRILTDMENKIFFVCIVTKGTPSSDTPCGLDNKTTIGVTYDDKKIYDQALSYISQAYNECSIPRDFIDFILRYKALKICIKSQNYLDVIKYWNKFINSNNSVVPKCGCNG